MTTIAYSAGIVAYDSRETEACLIVDDNCNKRVQHNGINYFFCGRSADQDLLIDAIENGPREDYPDEVGIQAIIVKDGLVYTAGISPIEGFFWQTERQDNHIAYGSGQHHAITAMDCGKTAKQAVQLAAKRDTNTGGRIRTYKV